MDTPYSIRFLFAFHERVFNQDNIIVCRDKAEKKRQKKKLNS